MSGTSEDTGGQRHYCRIQHLGIRVDLDRAVSSYSWQGTLFKRIEEGLGGEEAENEACSETQRQRWQGGVQPRQ